MNEATRIPLHHVLRNPVRMNNGETALAIAVRNEDDIDIVFENGAILSNQRVSDYLSGLLQSGTGSIVDLQEWKSLHCRA